MKRFTLPQLLWYDKMNLEITFPKEWNVTYHPSVGADATPLSAEAMAERVKNPIGIEPIRERAKGCKEVVIVFDDFTRATPVGTIAQYVLEELFRAGVSDNRIRFLCALGAHGAHDLNMLRKKLGSDIIARFPVYNHNCYDHCTHLGDTTQGTPLIINDEYLSCDLRLAIGSVAPHIQEGFSGGGKIILPGISHIKSIEHLHTAIEGTKPEALGFGKHLNNPMSQDSMEAARLAGLDYKLDAILNLKGEICELMVGDPDRVFNEACEVAMDHYATEPTFDNDVVVANAYAKANEMGVSAMLGLPCVRSEGGILVFVFNAPEGQITHYVFRSFGKRYGGRRFTRRESFIPSMDLVVLTQYPERTATDWLVDPGQVAFTSTWNEVLAIIQNKYPHGGRAAIIPDATMQYFRESSNTL